MDVREKLVELLNGVQHYGTICTMSQMDDRYASITQVSNAEVTERLIAHGVTVQEWISVKERLPQEDLPFGALCEVVQVLLNDGSVTIGWCNRGLRCWFHMPIQQTKMVGHEYENTPVVAWQPLAQPPKED